MLQRKKKKEKDIDIFNSNSIIEHYKDIDHLKDDIDSFIPEEVIKYGKRGVYI